MRLRPAVALEHLQQPRDAPRPKNAFAARASAGLPRRAALAPAAAVQYSARTQLQQRAKNAARAPLQQRQICHLDPIKHSIKMQ